MKKAQFIAAGNTRKVLLRDFLFAVVYRPIQGAGTSVIRQLGTQALIAEFGAEMGAGPKASKWRRYLMGEMPWP